MNGRLIRANYCADHTVFVGSWLEELPVWKKSPPLHRSVILNGADTSVFNPDGFKPWSGDQPLKLVTHHWGANQRKGFDIYRRLDEMMEADPWRERVQFTYVGNLPPGFSFRNAKHVAPLDGAALAEEIRRHHGYLTASMFEPGGNHQNEGALCGLPMLYRRSGCLPEYCDGFGISFDEQDFESALEQYFAEYSGLVARMPAYPHTAEQTCRFYLELFEKLASSREEIVNARNIWRRPLSFLINQFPI